MRTMRTAKLTITQAWTFLGIRPGGFGALFWIGVAAGAVDCSAMSVLSFIEMGACALAYRRVRVKVTFFLPITR